MNKNLSGETFVINRLSPAKKASLLQRLYDLHRQIFSGVSKDKLQSTVIEASAEEILVRFYKTEDGTDVGFCILYRYQFEMASGKIVVFRSDAGLLDRYRRKLTTLSFGLANVFKYKFSHPFRKIYYFEPMVHPSSYHLFYKYFLTVYPSPKKIMPEHLNILRMALRERFAMKPALSGSQDAVNAGWITRTTEDEHRQWQKMQYPDIDFFFEYNPGYKQGDGLLLILPVSFVNLFYCLFRIFLRRCR